MVARNKLLEAPPYAVSQALATLGGNLRTARLRRNLTMDEMAQRIGTGKRAVADAEHGKPSTSMAVYAAMLWSLDLLGPLSDLAAPEQDAEGKVLARLRERRHARGATELDNDF